MKTLLIILFTLLFVSIVSADVRIYDNGDVAIDGVIVGNDNSRIIIDNRNQMEKCFWVCDRYKFDPKEDITAYELALILQMLKLDIHEYLKNLSDKEYRSVRRHLKCID